MQYLWLQVEGHQYLTWRESQGAVGISFSLSMQDYGGLSGGLTGRKLVRLHYMWQVVTLGERQDIPQSVLCSVSRIITWIEKADLQCREYIKHGEKKDRDNIFLRAPFLHHFRLMDRSRYIWPGTKALRDSVLQPKVSPQPHSGLPPEAAVKRTLRHVVWLGWSPGLPVRKIYLINLPSHQLQTNNKILSQKQNPSKENNSCVQEFSQLQ